MKPIHPWAWRGRQVQPLTTSDFGDYQKQMERITVLEMQRHIQLQADLMRRTALNKKRDLDGGEVTA